MSEYTFTVRLDRAPTDDEQDRLYDEGLDDGNVIISGDRKHGSILVTREASTLDDAIVSVLSDVRRAGLSAVGIANEDLVGLSAIARRTGRTHESVRLLALGKRGPGGFPTPAAEGLYSWASVRRWFADLEGAMPSYDEDEDTLAAADLMLRARIIRPELGRLVEVLA
jgi:hypothetical protein